MTFPRRRHVPDLVALRARQGGWREGRRRARAGPCGRSRRKEAAETDWPHRYGGGRVRSRRRRDARWQDEQRTQKKAARQALKSTRRRGMWPRPTGTRPARDGADSPSRISRGLDSRRDDERHRRPRFAGASSASGPARRTGPRRIWRRLVDDHLVLGRVVLRRYSIEDGQPRPVGRVQVRRPPDDADLEEDKRGSRVGPAALDDEIVAS